MKVTSIELDVVERYSIVAIPTVVFIKNKTQVRKTYYINKRVLREVFGE